MLKRTEVFIKLMRETHMKTSDEEKWGEHVLKVTAKRSEGHQKCPQRLQHETFLKVLNGKPFILGNAKKKKLALNGWQISTALWIERNSYRLCTPRGNLCTQSYSVRFTGYTEAHFPIWTLNICILFVSHSQYLLKSMLHRASASC